MALLRTAPFVQASLDELQSQLLGDLFTPGDEQYDEARKAWNLSVEQHPAMIVVAENASDVAAAVRFAHDSGLGVAVQSTGHGVVRPADGGLLLITSRMTDVRVDPTSQSAWVEAGTRWGKVLEKAQAVGLAPLLGSSPDVGVVGYTLGGGMGWLARQYGLSADSVLSFELVTADGQIRRASETENSDLFWGLRGGGGSLAVITSIQIRLYPVTTVFGGSLIYPAEIAKEVFTHYREWIATAPDELTSSIALMNLPPLPQVPEFLRGKSVVMINGCYCGPVEQGEVLVKTWFDWQAPIASTFRAMPFIEVGTISNDPVDPMPSLSTGGWVQELSDETIDILIRYGVSTNGSSPLGITEIRHAGGAIAKVNKDANAFGHRDAPLLLHSGALTPTPEAYQAVELYIRAFKDVLQPHLAGVYLNFVSGKESRERIKDAYSSENYRRLTALKAKYDPDNVFCYSFNIRPSADSK